MCRSQSGPPSGAAEGHRCEPSVAGRCQIKLGVPGPSSSSLLSPPGPRRAPEGPTHQPPARRCPRAGGGGPHCKQPLAIPCSSPGHPPPCFPSLDLPGVGTLPVNGILQGVALGIRLLLLPRMPSASIHMHRVSVLPFKVSCTGCNSFTMKCTQFTALFGFF